MLWVIFGVFSIFVVYFIANAISRKNDEEAQRLLNLYCNSNGNEELQEIVSSCDEIDAEEEDIEEAEEIYIPKNKTKRKIPLPVKMGIAGVVGYKVGKSLAKL